MRIKTHDWTTGLTSTNIVNASKAKALLKLRRPGDFVTTQSCGGFGMLIAVERGGNETCTVLWSVLPDERLLYNPLAVEEDIYIPVGCQKGSSCPGCLGRGCHKPIRQPTEHSEEDISWFRKQLDRMLGKRVP